MVSAWASANGIVLGQIKTNDKSNEITAIPELIKTLEIEGCIVTIDAMGCQKKISTTIIDKGADYIFSLKGNQNNLHENIKLYFQEQLKEKFKGSSFFSFCFIFIDDEVIGVILKADIEKPVVRMWLCGMIIVFEIFITD